MVVNEKEKGLLIRKLNSACGNDDNPFCAFMSYDKEVVGASLSFDKRLSKLEKILMFQALYDSFVSLKNGIVSSISDAINLAFSTDVYSFQLLSVDQGIVDEEKVCKTFFYLENAIYRVFSMWDLLAQIINIHYDVGFKMDSIDCKSFLKNKKVIKKVFPEFIKRISSHICEEHSAEENTGNFSYLYEQRNQFTHRLSLKTQLIAGEETVLPEPPVYILNKTVEEFVYIDHEINFMFEVVISSGKYDAMY